VLLYHYCTLQNLSGVLRDGRLRADMPANPINGPSGPVECPPEHAVFFTTSEYWVPAYPSPRPDVRIIVPSTVAKYGRGKYPIVEYFTDEDVPESAFLAVETWAGRDWVSHSEWPADPRRPFLQRDVLWCAVTKQRLKDALYHGVIPPVMDLEGTGGLIPPEPLPGPPSVWVTRQRGWTPPESLRGRATFRIGIAGGNFECASYQSYLDDNRLSGRDTHRLRGYLNRSYGADVPTMAIPHAIPGFAFRAVQEWDDDRRTWIRYQAWRPQDEYERLCGP
jgi:hypothetical protein